MAIITNFVVPKGQDFTVQITVVEGDDLTLTTATITSWTAILEIRSTWGATTVSYSSTAATIDNTLKTISFTVPKAGTQDLASGRYLWQVRRTNVGAEKVLAEGKFELGKPPPSGKTA